MRTNLLNPLGPLIVLASRSARRRELLTLVGAHFDCVPVDLDETPLPMERAEAHVLRLAEAKARAALEQGGTGRYIDPTVILGADTVVSIDREILGKPAQAENGNGIAWPGAAVPQRIERGEAGTHQRGRVDRRQLGRRSSATSRRGSLWTRRGGTPFRGTARSTSRRSRAPTRTWWGCPCRISSMPCAFSWKRRRGTRLEQAQASWPQRVRRDGVDKRPQVPVIFVVYTIRTQGHEEVRFMGTYSVRASEITHDWFVVDAEGQILTVRLPEPRVFAA